MRNVTLAFVLLIAGYTAPAVAQEKDWYVVFDCGSSRGCQQFWGAGEKRLGPATKAECDEAIRNRSANSYPIGARCVQNPAGGGATTPPSSTASALESTIANGLSALPLDQQLVIGAGYSLLRLIFDDADRSDARARERARAEAARADAAAAEASRLAEEQARLAAEELARNQQRAQGILDRMKGDRVTPNSPGSAFKTGDAAVESLRQPPPPTEPLFSKPQQTYVDLRNLRVGAALLLMSQTLPAAQAKFAADQAMAVAEGLAEPGRTFKGALPEISEDGLRAFQEANNEYRRVRDSGRAPFQGSPDAEARYNDTRRNLLAKRAMLGAAAQSASPDAAASLKQAAEAIQQGVAGLDRLHGLPLAAAAREAALAADEWRKNIVIMLTSPDVSRDDWVTSVKFIKEAQTWCARNQPDNHGCQLTYAYDHKGDVMTEYVARRNAEHFLLSKFIATDPTLFPVPGAFKGSAVQAAAGKAVLSPLDFVVTPAYTVHKLARPATFRTSPPSVGEVAFGWMGIVAGLGWDPLGIEQP